MNSRNTILIGAAFAALLLWSKRANAFVPSEESLIENDVESPPNDLILFEDDSYDVPLIDNLSSPSIDMPDTSDPERNLRAFLYMLRSAEHKFPDDVVDSDNSYQVFFGGSYFHNISDHPVLTGEKRGVPLSDSICQKAGYRSGCVSTAAGAYQITKPTWQGLRSIPPRLPDFSPASQDEAARRLLDQIGALPYIERGDFATAIRVAGQRWASLPGARGGQKQRSPAFAQARIDEGLALG